MLNLDGQNEFLMTKTTKNKKDDTLLKKGFMKAGH